MAIRFLELGDFLESIFTIDKFRFRAFHHVIDILIILEFDGASFPNYFQRLERFTRGSHIFVIPSKDGQSTVLADVGGELLLKGRPKLRIILIRFLRLIVGKTGLRVQNIHPAIALRARVVQPFGGDFWADSSVSIPIISNNWLIFPSQSDVRREFIILVQFILTRAKLLIHHRAGIFIAGKSRLGKVRARTGIFLSFIELPTHTDSPAVVQWTLATHIRIEF